MRIIPVHHNKSQTVKDYEQIREYSDELKKLADDGPFIGEHQSCFALHHSQVSEYPFNFFVLSKKAEDLDMESWLVINPEVWGIGKDNVYYKVKEACMSWPFRKPKNVRRFASVRVSYQVQSEKGKLETIEREVEGLLAQIFQHECDHSVGKTIFD